MSIQTRNSKFLIVALPRTRSTWLSNYLTTDNTICYHDLLAECSSFEDFQVKETGTIETGMWMFPDYIASFNGTIIYLGRNPKEIQVSSNLTGWYSPLKAYKEAYDSMVVKENYYSNLDLSDYNKVSEIAEKTIGIVPAKARFDLLKNMRVNTLGF